MTENHNNSNNLNSNTQNDLPKPPAGYQENPNNEQSAGHHSNEADSQFVNTTPKTPPQAQTLDVSSDELIVLQSIKRYSLFAIVGSGFSFIIGGTLLSLLALWCGFTAFRKTKAFCQMHETTDDQQMALFCKLLKRRAIAALIFSGFAVVMNIIAIVMIYPYLQEAMTTGDYSSILGGSATNIGGSSSTWG